MGDCPVQKWPASLAILVSKMAGRPQYDSRCRSGHSLQNMVFSYSNYARPNGDRPPPNEWPKVRKVGDIRRILVGENN